ncbi:MAG: hypothetical protein HC888_02355 [Candidatus Competibacteraceae bacterium]|nr:hypothetical protein [Candidatus Competibacteraceae bacterium]
MDNAKKCKYIYDFFECRIYVRRSRSNYSLPVRLPVSLDLATICGLIVSEGHIKKGTCESCNSRYDVVFTGKVGTLDGKYDKDKQRIRDIFSQKMLGCLGWKPSSINDIQIDFNGKLSYLFFLSLGLVNDRGDKQIPKFVFNNTREVADAFLWGFYLGDGSQSHYKDEICRINLFTSSRPLYVGLYMLLQALGHCISSEIRAGSGNVKDRYVIRTISPIGPHEPVILSERKDYGDSRRVQSEVQVLERDDYLVYDISVDECHNFIGGTLLDHNTIFDEGVDVKPLDALILAGSGKCLDPDTRVVTNRGLLSMGEIIGENLPKEECIASVSGLDVASIRGNSGNVEAFYNGGQKERICVRDSDGGVIIGSETHRVRIVRDGRFKWCKLSDLKITDYLVNKIGTGMFGDSESLSFEKSRGVHCLKLPEFATPLLARLIGYCMAEGCLTQDRSVSISNVFHGDEIHFNEFEKQFGLPIKRRSLDRGGPDGCHDGWEYRINSAEFADFVRHIVIGGAACQKSIPIAIRSANRDVQLEFIRAIFDGEAHVDRVRGTIEVTMCPRDFISDLRLMLLNFGIYCRIKPKRIGNVIRAWRLTISGVSDVRDYIEKIGFLGGTKQSKALAILDRKANPNKDVIPGLSKTARRVRCQSNLVKSTKDHKVVSAWMVLLAPSSSGDMSRQATSKCLNHFNDVHSAASRKMRLLMDKSLRYSRIATIDKIGIGPVVDFSVSNDHYISNGFISHNSSTRALQRIGRVIRKYDGPLGVKKNAIVVDFNDTCKYMSDHSKRRRKIYETEPLFDIKDLKI